MRLPRPAEPPRGLGARISLAYAAAAGALLVGLLALVPAWSVAATCDEGGWGCLRYAIGALALAAAVTAVAYLVLAHWARLGSAHGLLTVVLVVSAAFLPTAAEVRLVLALAAPALAAALTRSRRRSLVSAAVGASVVAALVLGAWVTQERERAAQAEERYAAEGVSPVGPADDGGWSYEEVAEQPGDVRGFVYVLADGPDHQVRVRTTAAADDPALPESGLFRVVEVGDTVTVLTPYEGPVSGSELDRLADGMEEKTPRWLAERQCLPCRVLW